MKKHTQILAPTAENIARVADALKNGDIAAMPTETVYGLAGNALDARAVAKIFDAKQRPTFDPLIVHLSEQTPVDTLVDIKKLSKLARERLEILKKNYWPGPLTLVLPKLALVPDLVTSGLNSVAIRVPRHSIAQALLTQSGLPLAAPSANRFGRISPTKAQDVMNELQGRLDWILDGGPCEIGVESSVLELRVDGSLNLLRPGGISQLEIEKLLQTQVGRELSLVEKASPSPGLLENHYAPGCPLFLLSGPALRGSEPDRVFNEVLRKRPGRLGVLLYSGKPQKIQSQLSLILGLPVVALSLSENGDPLEAAKNLFSHLRQLDQSGAEILLAEPCPTISGIGHAITDRLARAARK